MMLLELESTSLGSNGLLGSIALGLGGLVLMGWVLTRQRQALAAQLATEQQRTADLTAAMQTLTQEQAQAQAQTELETTELQGQIVTLTAQNSTLGADLEDLRSQLTALGAKHDGAIADLAQLRVQITSLSQNNAALDR